MFDSQNQSYIYNIKVEILEYFYVYFVFAYYLTDKSCDRKNLIRLHGVTSSNPQKKDGT